jgi:N6-adenosine-specific RNA methylase IME4
MSLNGIKNLDVSRIAATNSVLFIWTTFPMLEKCFEVIKCWGFVYKTIGFNWVKTNSKSATLFWGMGFYTRSNSEICLIATKGKGLTRKSASVHSIIESPVEQHSKKPKEVRERIVKLYGYKRRIELFASEKAKGWDCLGDGIDGRDIRQILNN